MKITQNDLAAFIPGLISSNAKTLLHIGSGFADRARLPDCFQEVEWHEVKLDKIGRAHV